MDIVLLCCAAMKKRVSVTIVGPGSLGGALAIALHDAGYRVKEVVYRGDRKRAEEVARKAKSRAVAVAEASFAGDAVWISVGDAVISGTAKAIRSRAEWKGKYVFHSSGALSSEELEGLKKKGARVASVHPMMSFVRSATADFRGVPFALEGDAEAKRVASEIVKALGGTSFELKKKDKPLYHALGAFSSPLLIAHLAAAEKVGRKLGFKPEETRRVIAPILKRTLGNYLEHGSAAAFSGPMMRGDVETIRQNLRALERVPGTEEIYRALARMAVKELPVRARGSVARLVSG
jgi:predicted short-subunit dehydrogenase-like oxidoreductase (DUF2520 family)